MQTAIPTKQSLTRRHINCLKPSLIHSRLTIKARDQRFPPSSKHDLRLAPLTPLHALLQSPAMNRRHPFTFIPSSPLFLLLSFFLFTCSNRAADNNISASGVVQ